MSFCTFGGGLVAAVVVALGGTAYSQSAVQWRVEDGGNGHWYLPTVDVFPDFWSSQQFAVQRGAHLVTLTSAAENEFVASLAPGDFMLGGYQDLAAPDYVEPSGGWKWVTGEPWKFTAWNSYWVDEPNNGGSPGLEGEHYLQWWRFGDPWRTRWNDGGNDFVSNWWNGPAIIEWSADCNADGIVDYGQVRNGSLPDYDGDNVPDCCEAGTPCTVGNYPVQWRVDDGGNGHWYEGVRHPAKLRRSDAAMLAAQRSGELVCIGSQFESHWVYDRIASDPGLWLIEGEFALGPWNGARKVGQAWTWDNSEAWQHADWLAAEPNNTGAFVHFYNSTLNPGGSLDIGNAWNDNYDLPVVASYIIEWSADCDADGVVDYGQILRGEVADINANGIPDTCDCPADINQSGTIDAEDLAYVLFAWGMTGVKAGGADINADAIVDANDLSLVLGSWGNCPQ